MLVTDADLQPTTAADAASKNSSTQNGESPAGRNSDSTSSPTTASTASVGSLGAVMENGGYVKDSSNHNGKRRSSKASTHSKQTKPAVPPAIELTVTETDHQSTKSDPIVGVPDKKANTRFIVTPATLNPSSAEEEWNHAATVGGVTSLSRLKSRSDQNIYSSSLQVPDIPKKRSGSLASLTQRTNNRKQYIPVPHHTKGDYDTVNSFADFIVSNNSRRKNISSALSPFSYARSPAKNKNMRRRLLYKNGECNVTHKHISRVNRHYLADMFTTLIDLKWRWALMIFIASFALTWIIFACIWFIIGLTHDDFNPANIADDNYTPCVSGVTDFTTAFLFSLETQHTIGYGTRAMNSECIEAVIILMLQSIVGVMAQALVTGMIFAKISRPKKRAETLMFSKVATISLRDGNLCLMFRIGDMRNSHLVEAHVRALVIRRRVTKEGEVLPLDHQDVDLGFGDGTDRLLIIWPVIVIHKIDKNSPFWRMSQQDLERENFELIVILEGTIESTGMTTQARTSYLPSEIQWGRRLERLVTFQKEGGEYQVDYTWFDSTVPVETPTCSAKELAAQQSDDSAESDVGSTEEFTLMRADSIQTSDTDETDGLLLPQGDIALEMFETGSNNAQRT